MPKYDAGGRAGVGCVLVLKAKGNHKGELSIDQLEEIDGVMLEVGSSRTGQRINVSTTRTDNMVSIEYAYQESILSKSLRQAERRLDAFTVIEEPFIVADVKAAEFKT